TFSNSDFIEKVAGINRNGWPLSIRISGRFESESMATLDRNIHKDFGTEYLLTFSCKTRSFSPSFDAKRLEEIFIIFIIFLSFFIYSLLKFIFYHDINSEGVKK
ncbi:MAG: hypothetical protein AB1410_06075, partial [Acidobacteriota bacterium]